MPEIARPTSSTSGRPLPCKVAVIWIDWYAYHVARFRGLMAAPSLAGRVCGIELVGGIGVHAGLKFREDLPANLPVHTLMPQSSWSEAGQLRLAYKLWLHLSDLNPEAVLVPGYYNLPAIAAALWAVLHRRTSILMTESTAEDHARGPWKETAKSILVRSLFDFAVTGGIAHQRYLRQLGFDADRIGRFYDVVDNRSLQEATALLRHRSAAEFGLPQTYFLFVGRLAEEKNVRGLLDVWLTYRELGGAWPLVLVGDGPEAGSLRDRAQQSNFAQDVYFAGHKSSRDLPLYYAFAGCFVLPSSREPWGLVVNEAMAASLPVIVSKRCGCTEDLVHSPRNGFVFDPSRPGDLLACLTRVSHASSLELAGMRSSSAEIVALYSPGNFGLSVASLAHRGAFRKVNSLRGILKVIKARFLGNS